MPIVKYSVLVASIFLLFLLVACGGQSKKPGKAANDLEHIRQQGEITAVTLYSSTSYFRYRTENMGYEYELIHEFAKSLGLKLKIKVAENHSRLLEMLEAGEADVIAYPIPINSELKKKVIYCGNEQQSTQVIVQRAGRGDTLLKNVTELIGQEVYVIPQTKYAERLENLNNELGGGIHIIKAKQDTITTEDLIEMVSKGKIKYTVSSSDIAKINRTYYGNIHTDLEISFPQRAFWAVRKESPHLAEAIDSWASGVSGKKVNTAASKRYFEISKTYMELSMPEIDKGRISPFDSLFKQHAPIIGWDWKLIASIAYQESHFMTSLTSWAGARGVMGIMPRTGRAFGASVEDLKVPEISIEVGVKCLKAFNDGLTKITNPDEKIKFTLASYNAGIGHIYDAQRLATKLGKDPHIWHDNVEECLRLKRDPQYYNDPVCKHGYLRGTETIQYVKEVLERFSYYQQKLPDQ